MSRDSRNPNSSKKAGTALPEKGSQKTGPLAPEEKPTNVWTPLAKQLFDDSQLASQSAPHEPQKAPQSAGVEKAGAEKGKQDYSGFTDEIPTSRYHPASHRPITNVAIAGEIFQDDLEDMVTEKMAGTPSALTNNSDTTEEHREAPPQLSHRKEDGQSTQSVPSAEREHKVCEAADEQSQVHRDRLAPSGTVDVQVASHEISDLPPVETQILDQQEEQRATQLCQTPLANEIPNRDEDLIIGDVQGTQRGHPKPPSSTPDRSQKLDLASSSDEDGPTLKTRTSRKSEIPTHECRMCGKAIFTPRSHRFRGSIHSQKGFRCEACQNSYCAKHVVRVSGLFKSLMGKARFRCTLCFKPLNEHSNNHH